MHIVPLCTEQRNHIFLKYMVHLRRRVLQMSDGIDEPNGLVWELTLALFICWCLVYFCVWKGIKLIGKVCIDTLKLYTTKMYILSIDIRLHFY